MLNVFAVTGLLFVLWVAYFKYKAFRVQQSTIKFIREDGCQAGAPLNAEVEQCFAYHAFKLGNLFLKHKWPNSEATLREFRFPTMCAYFGYWLGVHGILMCSLLGKNYGLYVSHLTALIFNEEGVLVEQSKRLFAQGLELAVEEFNRGTGESVFFRMKKLAILLWASKGYAPSREEQFRTTTLAAFSIINSHLRHAVLVEFYAKYPEAVHAEVPWALPTLFAEPIA